MRSDRQTDIHDEANSRFSQFADAPNKTPFPGKTTGYASASRAGLQSMTPAFGRSKHRTQQGENFVPGNLSDTNFD